MASTTALRRKAADSRGKRKEWKPQPPNARDRALEVMQRDFTRTGRVLSGHFDLKCHVHYGPGAPAPAWSDMSNIWADRDHATPLQTDADYGAMMGLNYHELFHVMFTPTIPEMHRACGGRSNLAERLEAALVAQQNGTSDTFMFAWNMMEDPRIEALGITKYPYLNDYLILTSLHFIIGDGSAMDEAFLFTRGRRYLPRKLRIRARRKFKAQQHVVEIARLIDEYRTLDMTSRGDLQRAHKLVTRMTEILDEINPPQRQNHVCSAPRLVAARIVPQPGKGGSGQQQRAQRKQDQAEAAVLVAAVKKAAQEEEQTGGAGNEPATSQGGGGGGQDGKGQGGEQQDHDKAPDDQEGGKGGGPSGRGGKGHQGRTEGDDGTGSDKDVVAEATASAVSDRVKADARQVKRVLVMAGNLDPAAQRTETFITGVPDTAKPLVRKVMGELRKVEVDADPYWRTHETDGRLNMRRAMHADPTADDLHDRWVEGQITGTDAEVFVIADLSGSMYGLETVLGLAMWATQRACNTLGVVCSQLAFSSGSPSFTVVYGPRDRAQPDQYPGLSAGGNTEPGAALVEAHRVLSLSKKRRRALVILTDGMWESRLDPAEQEYGQGRFTMAEHLIADLNVRGVHTALAHLSASGYLPGGRVPAHRCQVARQITTLEEWPLFVRDQLVKELRRVV